MAFYMAGMSTLVVNYQLFHRHSLPYQKFTAHFMHNFCEDMNVRRRARSRSGKGKKFSPVQKWCRRRVGTGNIAVIALRLCIRRLLLVVVHHVLLVVRSAVFL